MRVIFGVLGLLLVLATVGLLVKKQMGGMSAAPATSQMQGQQLQQQMKQTVEGSLQQARPMPEDK
ncbi:MAG: hypothetical protein WA174_12845 [Rhodoferax sp.]